MNLQEVVACLRDPEKCADFVARLTNAGEHSKAFLQVQSAMIDLRMDKSPRGVENETILQHSFRFTDVEECFRSFRLVSKSWKHAVETMRFNRFIRIRELTTLPFSLPDKYLQAFRKLFFEIKHIQLQEPILRNMKKLNHIRFAHYNKTLTEEDEQFMIEILRSSQATLTTLYTMTFCCDNLYFPKLERLELIIDDDIISPKQFEKYFPQVFKNMPNIEVIKLMQRNLETTSTSYRKILTYLEEHYSKHIIALSCSTYDPAPMPDFVSLKILYNVKDLTKMKWTKFASCLEYVELVIDIDSSPMKNGWDRYQEIFDQYVNLRAISVVAMSIGYDHMIDAELELDEFLSTLSDEMSKIWQTRIEYFNTRGVEIKKMYDFENDDLPREVAQQVGISWRLHC